VPLALRSTRPENGGIYRDGAKALFRSRQIVSRLRVPKRDTFRRLAVDSNARTEQHCGWAESSDNRRRDGLAIGGHLREAGKHTTPITFSAVRCAPGVIPADAVSRGATGTGSPRRFRTLSRVAGETRDRQNPILNSAGLNFYADGHPPLLWVSI